MQPLPSSLFFAYIVSISPYYGVAKTDLSDHSHPPADRSLALQHRSVLNAVRIQTRFPFTRSCRCPAPPHGTVIIFPVLPRLALFYMCLGRLTSFPAKLHPGRKALSVRLLFLSSPAIALTEFSPHSTKDVGTNWASPCGFFTPFFPDRIGPFMISIPSTPTRSFFPPA